MLGRTQLLGYNYRFGLAHEAKQVVSLFVAITDDDWFAYLAAQPQLDEVNFWQPRGKAGFQAIKRGELFLFKLHSPRNYIVGGGIFERASSNVPLWLAWDSFGTRNGSASYDEMRDRISRYTHARADDRTEIGCRLLEAPFFLPEESWIPVPASWSPHIQVGKTFTTDQTDGQYLWERVHEWLSAHPVSTWPVEPRRFGTPMLVLPRLGQGTFRIAVTETYQRRCAVTEERTLPVLEAAHIRPYSRDGTHEINNGLLLRTDLHKLFDRGYVTVGPDQRFEVSSRIKEEFENGRDYYALHGKPIRLPKEPTLQPSPTALAWHREKVYLG
jgi:putative restriction endonuclease